MDVEIRTPEPDELADVVAALDASWGHHAGEEELEDARTVAELSRTFVAFDAGRPVGVTAAISFEVTLPGGATVAAAGVTEVGVLPTHRRRGLLTALLARLHDDSHDRGEIGALLVAAEGALYRRFGYGVGMLSMAVQIDRARASFSPDGEAALAPGELRLLGPEEAVLLLPDAYDRYRRAQPGEVSRSESYWEVHLRDRERWRDGASARFIVAHEASNGDIGGYAAYRMRDAWHQGLPAFSLDVEEVVAADPGVRAALWRYLLNVDLVGTVSAGNLPLDDPLRWLLADPRAPRVTRIRDLLWLRLDDVGRALAARTYSADHPLVLEVFGAGTYGLDGRPTEAEPDLSLSASDLATAYLGGARFTSLARAGRVVEHRTGAAATADTVFASDPPPHSVTDF